MQLSFLNDPVSQAAMALDHEAKQLARRKLVEIRQGLADFLDYWQRHTSRERKYVLEVIDERWQLYLRGIKAFGVGDYELVEQLCHRAGKGILHQ